jgi:hypothetical protein
MVPIAGFTKSLNEMIFIFFINILFSGVTSLPLKTTSRPSLGGENQM